MNRGFTLIEIVVAVALVGFVGLAGATLLEAAARSVREAESRERLLWVAGSVLDSLRRQEGWSGGDSRPWLAVPVGGDGVTTAGVR
jgi:prepilin-type N-terminal cleavage/methylation domain-containing protein